MLPLTLMCDLDLTSGSRKLISYIWMSLIILFITTRYDACGLNSLLVTCMTICSIFVTVDLYQRSSAPVKIPFTFINRWSYCKLVYEFGRFYRIWYMNNRSEKTKMTSHNLFSWNSKSNIPRAYKTDIPNFNLVWQKRAEIHNRDVQRIMSK